jgi:hypothetical protein
MAYADPSDLASRWRELSSDEDSVAAMLFEDVAVMLDAEFPTQAASVVSDAGMANRFLVASVLMVKSAMLRGDGVKSETTGPYSVSYDNASGALFVTNAIRALIRGARMTATSVGLE